MPALPSPGKVLRFDQFFQLSEDLKAKVGGFYNYLTGPPTIAELNTIAAAAQVAMATDLGSLINGLWKMTEIVITDLSSPTGAVGSSSTVNNGSRSGGFVGADAAMIEHDIIARRYRGGHPRRYWPFGVSSDLFDGQTWTAAFAAACEAALATYINSVQTEITSILGTSVPVNVSYYHGSTVFTGPTGRVRNVSTPRGAPIVDPITFIQCKIGVASQRRRLLRLA